MSHCCCYQFMSKKVHLKSVICVQAHVDPQTKVLVVVVAVVVVVVAALVVKLHYL